jgi:outer membrane lipoprotein SlyB
MKYLLLPALVVCALAVGSGAAPQAQAKGCIKGAVVGGVAGHYAGHHALIGAVGGCVVGHHVASVHAREQRAQHVQQDSGNGYNQGHYDPAH